MTSTALPENTTIPDFATRTQAWFKAATPFLILLALTCAVRLPFFMQADDDEFFFALMAQRWLEGNLPYATGFDVKPPGIFFIFAVFQSLFGASLATIKGMEILFVALGALGLYQIMDRHASRTAAMWAGGLYPVYMLALAGTNAAVMIIQAPFIIFGIHAALRASDDNFKAALISGLLVGMAGMIKQTAIFEATMIAIVLIGLSWRTSRIKTLLVYAAAAALPFAVFAAYFWANGYLWEMLNAIIFLAKARTDPAVLAGYDPKFAFYLTPQGALVNGILLSAPLLFLWACALFCGTRWQKVTVNVPPKILMVAGGWMLAALAGAAMGRMLATYYLLAIVPPLIVLSSAFLAHGLELNRQQVAFAVIVAAVLPAIIGRDELFERDNTFRYDYPASQNVAQKLKILGLKNGDDLFMFNRNYGVYLMSGGRPTTPYFYTAHYLSRFVTPSADPLGDNIRAKPRYIVVANPNIRSGYDIGSQYDRMFAVLKSEYRLVDQVTGTKDSFSIYVRN